MSAAGAAPPSDKAETTGAQKPITFSVKKWDAVETCAICKTHIMSPCIECAVKENHKEGDCTVAWGVCNHAFHFHCISRWLQTRNVCPLDNRPWQFRKSSKGSTAKST